eukprot:262174_1
MFTMSAHEMHSTKYRWHQLNVLILQSLLLLTEVISNGINTDTGSWDNWMTGYRVNDKHDGYLDIGKISFIPQNLNLSYSIKTNCTNDISLFANGRIYCTSRNMILSYYPQNGSVAFWYMTMTDRLISNPTFSQNSNYQSVIAYSYNSMAINNHINIYSIDALSGNLQHHNSLSGYSGLSYIVGSSNGEIYFVSAETANGGPIKLYAYNINSGNISQNPTGYVPRSAVPVICNDLIILSHTNATTYAYTQAPNFDLTWTWISSIGSNDNSGPKPIPVCLKDNRGYRVIVKASGLSNDNCYLLSVKTGALLYTFKCGTLPIIKYHEKTNFVDIAIFGTADNQNVTIAVQTKNDEIVNKELWYNTGNIDHAFIVDKYFITGWSIDEWTINVVIYDVNNGDVVWNKQFNDTPYKATFYIFGGIVEDTRRDITVMIIIRIGQIYYAYSA